MADLLQTTKLRKEFGGLVAVDDVDFTIPVGAIASLIGPNGAGKTSVGEPRVDGALGAVSSSPRAKTAGFAGAFALGFEGPPRTPSFSEVAMPIGPALRRERGLASARARFAAPIDAELVTV